MITYRKFWERCADAGISKNKLKNYYKIGKGTVDHLVKDENVSTKTLNRLCYILHCDISDIAEFHEDETEEKPFVY